MIKSITLSDGNLAWMSHEDWLVQSRFNWSTLKSSRNTTLYAYRQGRKTDGPNHRHAISLHRAILGLNHGDPRQCDHVNRNGLDCTRETTWGRPENGPDNIRVCDGFQNAANKGKRQMRCAHSQEWSRYKGVARKGGYSFAALRLNHVIGYCDSEELAAKLRDFVARITQKEYAHLNFPDWDRPGTLQYMLCIDAADRRRRHYWQRQRGQPEKVRWWSKAERRWKHAWYARFHPPGGRPTWAGRGFATKAEAAHALWLTRHEWASKNLMHTRIASREDGIWVV